MWLRTPSPQNVIKAHRKSGRFVTVGSIQTFILDIGAGPAVLCLHGVPTSSFLYRKLVRELALLGHRGIAFDFPGLGLTDRPVNFDYSFRGLRDFALKVIDILRLEKFHLVVHDIGGPIGFALAALTKPRILSITVLNTWLDVVHFQKPLPMRPFSLPILGEIELASVTYATWYLAFSTMAVADMSRIAKEEVYAYVDLLKKEDGGKAFLQIMRNFENSDAYRDLCLEGVQHVSYRIQVIWGAKDPGLTLARYGKEIREIVKPVHFFEVDAKHLLQEDQFRFIAGKIVSLTEPR